MYQTIAGDTDWTIPVILEQDSEHQSFIKDVLKDDFHKVLGALAEKVKRFIVGTTGYLD